ncbi:hypothetical protein [Geothrix campi]|uniref:hypothetical protein n=1 Tax=Geothrix campi TaxID=2966450 RepID=UPI00214921D1|nr:hypothetical protein [Geothrix sp. SG10]
MHLLNHRMGRLTALLILGSSFLLAQEKGIGFDLKLRAASGLSTNDHLNASAFGFGLNVRYGFEWGTLNGELGYFYKPGRQYRAALEAPAAGMPAAVDSWPDPIAGGSVDSRKNSLTQLNARFSYERAISNAWSWQAGLQLGQSKFRHEYIGDVADLRWATYEDTYNGTPTKSVFTVNPFAGVTYQINQDSAFELNLISISYTAINFHHAPGSAIVSGDPTVPGSHLVYAGDHLEEIKRNSLHIEIGYTFRF